MNLLIIMLLAVLSLPASAADDSIDADEIVKAAIDNWRGLSA